MSWLHEPKIVAYPWTLALATLLGLHGKRSGSLSTSGAVAAGVFGYCTLANPLRVFGVSLLAFYLSGSRATKYKAHVKSTLEEDERGPQHCKAAAAMTKPGGNRTAMQVACNAWIGTLCAVAWRLLYSGEYQDGKAWTGRIWLPLSVEQRWCTLDQQWGWSRALVLGAVAFWSACAGDTFASELGMLSRSTPILITSLRPCPRGTNGGVSAWGLFVSLAGGLLVGSCAALTLSIENPECRGYTERGLPFWALVVGVGAWSGLVGSLIDSLLGATLQQSLYSSSRRKIVHARDNTDRDDKVVNVPCSGFNVLSNNGVNLVSAAVAALAVVWWARPQ
ncbi:hypothetical protein ACM66B_006647 [Microbotryomycetes sp. NB124-2]